MELYEQIRREYEHGAGTIKGVAKKLGIHRRMVREALASAMPRERKIPERDRPKPAAAVPFIDAILEADRKAHRKQRHTAHRIWMRLCREMPAAVVAESTVRQYVRARKAAMGLLGQETFVAQSYQWGGEAQVDWYEGWAEFDGEERKTYIFCLRSMASGGAYHRAYPHATQQAFLEAHELAFAYFGGVFQVLRYDNLKSAVKKSCAGISAKRRPGLSGSAPTGDSRRSSALRARDTRRAAWKGKGDSSGETIWRRFRPCGIWKS